MTQQSRPPFSVVAHNATGIDGTKEQKQTGNAKESDGAQNLLPVVAYPESICKDA